ncbi:acetoacetate metabolism regulatory protein AtoC [Dethiosulfatarculus sandiegensis]|uniref:Acetoacetate metabolism regulatory protein AtoC n=2 Tax=Dethiosulfatarculus sandiegensis TaxID=1429043 RepID=A0A0D2IXX1_9BACT|nr:acetoacetate metabolism regulatory protein AtoC [Dethiosulfatarculus sandiegensis]
MSVIDYIFGPNMPDLNEKSPDADIREDLRQEVTPVEDCELEGLRILAEHVPAGVSLMQDGCLQFVNHTFCNMFGYSDPGEIIGRPASAMLVQEQQHHHIKMISRLEKDRVAKDRYQWTGVDKNGRKFWFEGHPIPITLGGRSAVLSFVIDITEFKQREELIERSHDQLKAENKRLKSSLDYRMRLVNIIGRSVSMQEVFNSILRAASSKFGIVIYGETGTGKELVAQAVHELSDTRDSPFVPVNCGAIPDELFEREFFGHTKGSFTGAVDDKTGYMAQAKGGTLFLDEVGELGPSGQVKLLRALGSGEYTPIGSAKPVKADFRVIAATNRDLQRMVDRGEFRLDLFYRIHVIPIHLPPLRERKEDIPFLAQHILDQRLKSGKRLPSKDLALLLQHDWPGNVRELQNVLERYLAFGNLDFMNYGASIMVMDESAETALAGDLRKAMAQLERRLILQALEKHNWNRSRTATALGLPRKTLFRKMQKLNIKTQQEHG